MSDILVYDNKANIDDICRDLRRGLRVRRLTVALLAEDQLRPLGCALLLQADCQDLGFWLGCLYDEPSATVETIAPLCRFLQSSHQIQVLRLDSGGQKPKNIAYTKSLLQSFAMNPNPKHVCLSGFDLTELSPFLSELLSTGSTKLHLDHIAEVPSAPQRDALVDACTNTSSLQALYLDQMLPASVLSTFFIGLVGNASLRILRIGKFTANTANPLGQWLATLDNLTECTFTKHSLPNGIVWPKMPSNACSKVNRINLSDCEMRNFEIPSLRLLLETYCSHVQYLNLADNNFALGISAIPWLANVFRKTETPGELLLRNNTSCRSTEMALTMFLRSAPRLSKLSLEDNSFPLVNTQSWTALAKNESVQEVIVGPVPAANLQLVAPILKAHNYHVTICIDIDLMLHITLCATRMVDGLRLERRISALPIRLWNLSRGNRLVQQPGWTFLKKFVKSRTDSDIHLTIEYSATQNFPNISDVLPSISTCLHSLFFEGHNRRQALEVLKEVLSAETNLLQEIDWKCWLMDSVENEDDLQLTPLRESCKKLVRENQTLLRIRLDEQFDIAKQEIYYAMLRNKILCARNEKVELLPLILRHCFRCNTQTAGLGAAFYALRLFEQQLHQYHPHNKRKLMSHTESHLCSATKARSEFLQSERYAACM